MSSFASFATNRIYYYSILRSDRFDTLKSIFLSVPLSLSPLKSEEEEEPGNVPGYLPEYISG
jgi:hypothetical protein